MHCTLTEPTITQGKVLMTFTVKKLATSVALASSLLLIAGCKSGTSGVVDSGTNQTADMVFTGGPIYTLDGDNRVVEALAIKDGEVVGVGSEQEMTQWISSSTNVIDLKGNTLMWTIDQTWVQPPATAPSAIR